MAPPLPVRTLPLILILLTVLALGTSGLCHLWKGQGGALGLGRRHCAFRGSQTQLAWPAAGGGLPMAVTRHQSWAQGLVRGLFHSQLTGDFNISSLSGLLSPALAESLLVALPPCHLTGGNATLMVRRANDSKVVKSRFVVPPCRGRRELVSVVDSGAGFTVTRLSAYQVTNLVPGTKYYISYQVMKGTVTESSREIPMSTLPRRAAESLALGMARTGGMVVITVLLSVAMFLLVLGLIITLALGAHK